MQFRNFVRRFLKLQNCERVGRGKMLNYLRGYKKERKLFYFSHLFVRETKHSFAVSWCCCCHININNSLFTPDVQLDKKRRIKAIALLT